MERGSGNSFFSDSLLLYKKEKLISSYVDDRSADIYRKLYSFDSIVSPSLGS